MAGPMEPRDSRFLGLDDEDAQLDAAGCVIAQFPLERTSTFGDGSANGPAAIIAASHEVELYDCVLGGEPFRNCGGIATARPLDFPDGEELGTSIERIRQATADWIASGKFVASIGGEHTAALGCIMAHIEAFEDLTIVQLDAHSDLRDEYHGSPYNHACVMRRVHERHPRILQVGIRSQCIEERDYQDAQVIPVWYAHDVHASDAAGQRDWISNVIGAAGRNVYLTFDCDCLDPSIMPATGTPEPGGLTWEQVTAFLDGLTRERNLVGFDVTELAPVNGLHHPQFTSAKLIYRMIGLTFANR